MEAHVETPDATKQLLSNNFLPNTRLLALIFISKTISV